MTDNRTTERVDHPPRVRKAIDELMHEKDATDSRATELLPCPFCGGEAKMSREVTCGYETFWVHCLGCRSQANFGHTEAEAIAAWNTRAQTVFGLTLDEVRQMMKRDAEWTCQLKRASWDNGTCTWGCVCSACDAHLEHETGIGYNFCPNCGAKVVDA